MTTERVTISGLRQLGERMRNLTNKVNKTIARRSVNAGASVLKKLAKAKAPIAPEPYLVDDGTDSKQLVQPKNIQRNIVSKNVKSDLTAEVVIAVRGKRKNGYASRIASLQEFGTVKQPAQPFMRPAFEEGKFQAADAIVLRLQEELDKVTT